MRLFFLFHGLILFSLSSNAEKLFNFDDHSLYDFNQIEYGQNQATGAIVDSVNGNLYGAVKSYDGLEFGRIIEGPTPYWTQGSFRTVLDCRGPLGMFLTPASGPIGLPSQRTGLWGTVYAASQASSASYASDVAIKLPEPARSISISVIKQARWEYTSEPDWTAESPLTTRIVTWEPLPQPELKIFALSASGTVLDVVNNIPKSDHVYSSACSSYYSNSRSMIADDYSGMAPITLTSNSSEAIAYVAVRAIDAIGQTTGSYGCERGF
jgi:hypothetical protein